MGSRMHPWRLAAILVLVFCALLSSVIANETVVEAGSHPAPAAASSAPAVLVVAHEGGRNPRFAQAALTWRADVLEMDAVAYRGQLYVSHQPVTSATADRMPLVSQVWPVASRARIVEFDLKDSSPAFNGLLVSFLRVHHGAGTPQVFVSGRNLASLRTIHAGAPWVFRFLSIGSERQLEALRQHPNLAVGIDGVSIRENLLDPATIVWLHQHRLLVFAWTVDSTVRAQELVRAGVDGITTDEPAIISMIARQEVGKSHILRDRTA